jgi:hypothetical protein
MAKYTNADTVITGLGLNPASHSAAVKSRLLVVLNNDVKQSDLTIGGVKILAELNANPATWGR